MTLIYFSIVFKFLTGVSGLVSRYGCQNFGISVYNQFVYKGAFQIKIAVSSDNHLDVNRQDVDQVLDEQSKWLNDHQVDYYLFAGDLFNNFAKTATFMDRLQARLKETKALYIAGNHDMLGAKSADQIEDFADNQYLHNRYLDLPGTPWRVIGNNGWYDYSFSTYHNDPVAVQRWKKIFWLDSSIPQQESDQDKMSRVLKQVDHQLYFAQRQNKQVLFLTHFAPDHRLLAPKPAGVSTPRRERVYQMVNAMMGSDQLGHLLESYQNVKAVFYGHLHQVHHSLYRQQLVYLHQAVGVRNKRHNEWQADNFFDQWRQTLRVLNDQDLAALATGNY